MEEPHSANTSCNVLNVAASVFAERLKRFDILYPFQVPPVPGVYTISINIQDPAGRRSIKTEPIEFRVAGP